MPVNPDWIETPEQTRMIEARQMQSRRVTRAPRCPERGGCVFCESDVGRRNEMLRNGLDPLTCKQMTPDEVVAWEQERAEAKSLESWGQ